MTFQPPPVPPQGNGGGAVRAALQEAAAGAMANPPPGGYVAAPGTAPFSPEMQVPAADGLPQSWQGQPPAQPPAFPGMPAFPPAPGGQQFAPPPPAGQFAPPPFPTFPPAVGVPPPPSAQEQYQRLAQVVPGARGPGQG